MLQPMPPQDEGPKWLRHTLLYPMENCAIKASVSGVLGGGMGLLFGLVFSTSPSDLSHIPMPGPDGKYPPPAPFQWRRHFRDMGKGALWYGRSFAVVGLLFAGAECVVEKARGKSDIWNGLGGGCVAGAMLSYKGGPAAMMVGCTGFAAFSLVIDLVMDHH